MPIRSLSLFASLLGLTAFSGGGSLFHPFQMGQLPVYRYCRGNRLSGPGEPRVDNRADRGWTGPKLRNFKGRRNKHMR